VGCKQRLDGVTPCHFSTVSRPFPRPATGTIAIGAINHYGDEVLKVFDIG